MPSKKAATKQRPAKKSAATKPASSKPAAKNTAARPKAKARAARSAVATAPRAQNATSVAHDGEPHYWLIKSEPEVFSIAMLEQKGQTFWEGVRNYQARNHLRAMKLGDLALFYHSNADPPGVAGVARVCREAYPDHSQFDPKSDYHDPKSPRDDPRWDMVDVEFVQRFREIISLDTLKADEALDGMLVRQRGMRLSVQPVARAHFEHVLGLAGSDLRL